ncbi:MAG TPA: hypothetical protein VFB68_07390 [Xanthobacteraceae bacterium]|nr:hypothetical protein [Xanthobacteraceae bacterium]
MKFSVVLSTAAFAAIVSLHSVPASAWPQMPNVSAADRDMLVSVAAVRRTTVRRGPAGTTVRRTTVRRGPVGTTVRTTAVRAPYVHGTTVRAWSRRAYYGTVVGGVALGAVAAAHFAPIPPAANLCWVWTTPAHTAGYWDYCKPVR